MKVRLSILVISVVSILILLSNVSKQKPEIPNIDAYAKRVFKILITQDSLAYDKELAITDKELKALLNLRIISDSLSIKRRGITKEQALEEYYKDAKERLLKTRKKTINFYKGFKSKNIDIEKCKYLYASYRVENERNPPNIITGRINIIFLYEGKRYALGILESVVANNKWKIWSMRDKIVLIDKPIDKPIIPVMDSAVVVDEQYYLEQMKKSKAKEILPDTVKH